MSRATPFWGRKRLENDQVEIGAKMTQNGHISLFSSPKFPTQTAMSAEKSKINQLTAKLYALAHSGMSGSHRSVEAADLIDTPGAAQPCHDQSTHTRRNPKPHTQRI